MIQLRWITRYNASESPSEKVVLREEEILQYRYQLPPVVTVGSTAVAQSRWTDREGWTDWEDVPHET